MKNKLISLVLAACSFTTATNATTAPVAATLVGATPSAFEVLPSGAPTIASPSAFHLTPQARSQARFKLQQPRRQRFVPGIGWSLEGLSVIHRCPQTLAQDGRIDDVDFTNVDRFCLDGKRLLNVSGVYGANGSECRTEINSFTKVVAHGNQAGGPPWFEVRTKSGEVM
jgi:hypothetical protein